LADQPIASIDVGLRKSQSKDDRTRAWALKLRGLCWESKASFAEALNCYDEALALDAKVGVKRRADQLRKALPMS